MFPSETATPETGSRLASRLVRRPGGRRGGHRRRRGAHALPARRTRGRGVGRGVAALLLAPTVDVARSLAGGIGVDAIALLAMAGALALGE